MSRLEQAVVTIARFLEENHVPYMVIGGVANALWGIARATLDVDVTVWVSETELEALIGKATQEFSSRTQDPIPFAKEFRVLPLETRDGMRVDMMFGQLPYERDAIQRALPQVIQGVEVRVCSPEDLILHKVVSERSKDREDVRGVILQQRGRLDRKYLDPKVKSLAGAMSRPDIWSWYEQCLREAGKSAS